MSVASSSKTARHAGGTYLTLMNHLDSQQAIHLDRHRSLCSAESMLEAAYLTLGKIAPDWQQLELHVGGAAVGSAVSEATGVTR